MAKTIVGKILQGLLSVFKKNFPKYIADSYDKIEPELRQEISWITQIVSKINDVLQSPGIDVLTALIPGNADDDFVKWARRVLPVLLSRVDPLTNEGKALISAKLVMDRTDMELSQALITSQVVYKKENS